VLRLRNEDHGVGFIVDAGPALGYGHAVRCLRLGNALEAETPVVFYPLSESCETFLRSASPKSEIRNPNFEMTSLPSLVITDLRHAHGITAKIHKQGSRHISIHDLGLAQCRSDVVIDGSVTRLFPYVKAGDRQLFIGPQYMITRAPVQRREANDTVLITFGGGSTANFAQKIADQLYRFGMKVIVTTGFAGSAPMSEQDLSNAMSSCRFAISASGVSLYDLLASGIPTIAVAFDRLQLRTADSFHELGAVLSAGLVEKLTTNKTFQHVMEMIENRLLVRRMVQAGQMLVDGKGLSRVVEIVRRQIWLTNQTKTYMTC